jgi:CheY-like chemotaxis protein
MKRFKIAIVENDPDERLFMAEAFKSFDGFELVGEFENGDRLIDWLDRRNGPAPELIVTDLNMPGKDGYDIISEVTTGYKDIDVIATSTSSIEYTRSKCLKMGAKAFVAKPEIFIDYEDYVNSLYVLLTSGPE